MITAHYKNVFESFLKQERFKAEPTGLYEPINYILSIGGKRVRPVLMMMAAELFGTDITNVLNQAYAVELFHNFTLLHDDIMDASPLRRGKQTVHVKYGENTAILSGDLMQLYGMVYLSRVEQSILRPVLDVYNETGIKVCEGQQMDMDFEKRIDVSVEEYIKMIAYKTAVLLGASMKIGALVAKASSQEAQYIYDFGYYLGIAFQLQDDWLDTFGQEKQIGKRIGGDISRNKKTFMLIKALESVQGEDKVVLLDWLKTEIYSKDKVEWITHLYKRIDIKKQTEELMHHYYELALSSLSNIKKGDKTPLITLAKKLQTRIF